MVFPVFGTAKGTREIKVRLRRAVAGGAHPRRISLFESFCRYKNNPNQQMWFGLFFFGTAKGTRTPDLLIRSQSLYPTELSPHVRIA